MQQHPGLHDMAIHQPQLIDFSAPPNVMPAMEAPPPAFDSDGLLALHADDMPAAGDTAPPWPQASVSLSLFNNYSTAGAYHHQPFTAAVSVAPDHQLQVPAAAASLQPPFQLIRSSKYLGPVKELLSEFCNLEGDFRAMVDRQIRAPLNKAAGDKWDDDVDALSSGLWGSPSLSSMDLLDLERRKARLLYMVEEFMVATLVTLLVRYPHTEKRLWTLATVETLVSVLTHRNLSLVDRRYRGYREQMRSVEVSFEGVAGAGAAQVYTRLARRAMSRHFRCLRDALVAQVRALKKAMGGSGGAAAPGATKGDTPRLRVVDQCLRQQPGAMQNYPWRPQRGLPERAVAVLRGWLFEHFLHPYPNDVDKHILARQTGLSIRQVSNWFINARVRLWKPMIEDMYKEEVTQQSEEGGAIVKAERSRGGGGGYQQQQQLHAVANRNNNSSMMSSSDGDHMFLHGYPDMTTMNGSAVSLTLCLQQQQPMMQQQQRSAGLVLLAGGDDEQLTTESVLPYRNLIGNFWQDR